MLAPIFHPSHGGGLASLRPKGQRISSLRSPSLLQGDSLPMLYMGSPPNPGGDTGQDMMLSPRASASPYLPLSWLAGWGPF